MRRAISVYGLIFPLIFAIAFVSNWQRTDGNRDVGLLYVGGANPRVGHSIYDPLPEPGVYRQNPEYNYPPPLAAVLNLMTYLGFVGFARVWLVILSAAYWTFAASCARIWTGKWGVRPTLVAGALLWFAPGVMYAWTLGNTDVIMWALAALAFVATQRGRGAALMSASLLKVTPIWAFLFAARDRRVLTGGALTFAAAGVLTLAVFGLAAFTESWTWLTRVAPSLAQGEWWIRGSDTTWSILGYELPNLSIGNISLSFLPIQILHEAGVIGESLPLAARIWLTGTSVGIPLVTGWRMRHTSPERQLAAVLVTSLLFSPILRISYLPMLVPCVLVLWRNHGTQALS
jgi:hypothetical protein